MVVVELVKMQIRPSSSYNDRVLVTGGDGGTLGVEYLCRVCLCALLLLFFYF